MGSEAGLKSRQNGKVKNAPWGFGNDTPLKFICPWSPVEVVACCNLNVYCTSVVGHRMRSSALGSSHLCIKLMSFFDQNDIDCTAINILKMHIDLGI